MDFIMSQCANKPISPHRRKHWCVPYDFRKRELRIADLKCHVESSIGWVIPHPAPMPSTSRCIQCNPSIDSILLFMFVTTYIVILFVSLTDEATIKATHFICFWKEPRITLSFVVKFKLVTVLSLAYSRDIGVEWRDTSKEKARE